MKIYYDKSVLQAAKERMRRVFSEFDTIEVSVSGGKDSTVILHLALEVARELGRIPLKAMFIDQEAEWQATVEMIRHWQSIDDIEMRWFQMPIRLFNTTSYQSDWLKCWEPEKENEWMRPKEPNSIKENVYGTDRFKELFKAIPRIDYEDKRVGYIVGMRASETPGRFLGMINGLTYKDISWGKQLNKGKHYSFYPIYDWAYTDVWKYIQENDLKYNDIYDKQYRHGATLNDMRVSNLHHETAVWSLFYLQQAEPQTYNKLINRIEGISSATKFGKDDFYQYNLPFMFGSWKEYRNYLLEKLIAPEHQEELREAFERQDAEFEEFYGERIHRRHVQVILANDWNGAKLDNIRVRFSSKKTRKRYKEKMAQKGANDDK